MEAASDKTAQIIFIPGEKILPNPYQPRKRFQSEQLQSLARSIKENGVLQPLSVRKIKNSCYYELISGERRLRASIIAGIAKIPCIEMDADCRDSALLSLLENLQREELDCFEEAESIYRLIHHFDITPEQVARRMGKSQEELLRKLRLLELPPEICSFIRKENLTERHARAILDLDSPKEMMRVLKLVRAGNMNALQTEKEVDRLLRHDIRPTGSTVGIFKDLRLFVNTISNAVTTMRSAGIEANSTKTETEDYIRFTVNIPKSRQNKVS